MSALSANTTSYEPPYRCWAEIDLTALEQNLLEIKASLPPRIRYVAVVKADAYGHGMTQTVSRLMQSGVDCFAVANLQEALQIQEIGSGWSILLLSPVLPEELKEVVAHRFIPTISDVSEMERFNAEAQRQNCQLPVHVKIDTGMGRLGIWHENAQDLLTAVQDASHLDLAGIYTHFARASSNDVAFTEKQRQRFLRILDTIPAERLSSLLIHADNSASLQSLAANSPFNAVRIGLLQFGAPPYPYSFLTKLTPRPVLSFHAKVGLVKPLPAGTGISYGSIYTLTKDSRVAIVTAGYGDGVPTSLSGQAADVLIAGQRCPILGRITMDQTIVDVTHVPDVQAGHRATFIGKQNGQEITVQEFGEKSGDISWEIFCSITKRVHRIYLTYRQ